MRGPRMSNFPIWIIRRTDQRIHESAREGKGVEKLAVKCLYTITSGYLNDPLLYLFDVRRVFPVFRELSRPIFQSRVSKKAVFWSRLSKHAKRAKCVRSSCYLAHFLCLKGLTDFSRIGHHLKGNSAARNNNVFRGHTPQKFWSMTPSRIRSSDGI